MSSYMQHVIKTSRCANVWQKEQKCAEYIVGKINKELVKERGDEDENN